MQAITKHESAFDAPLFPTHSLHLCWHEQAGYGCHNCVYLGHGKLIGTPLLASMAFFIECQVIVQLTNVIGQQSFPRFLLVEAEAISAEAVDNIAAFTSLAVTSVATLWIWKRTS